MSKQARRNYRQSTRNRQIAPSVEEWDGVMTLKKDAERLAEMVAELSDLFQRNMDAIYNGSNLVCDYEHEEACYARELDLLRELATAQIGLAGAIEAGLFS